MKKKIIMFLLVAMVMLMSTGCGIEMGREVNHSGYTVEWRCE